MLAAFFEIATAAARWCSLLLSWMMASRPSCRDFSLIRWDLVFLLSKVLTTLQCTTTSKQVGSCLANANSKIFFACGANKKAFGLRLPSLKAQDRAKLRRSETAEAAPSAEQTQTADQEDQEQAKEDQGREEEKVCCTSSESVDSIYLWKYISQC